MANKPKVPITISEAKAVSECLLNRTQAITINETLPKDYFGANLDLSTRKSKSLNTNLERSNRARDEAWKHVQESWKEYFYAFEAAGLAKAELTLHKQLVDEDADNSAKAFEQATQTIETTSKILEVAKSVKKKHQQKVQKLAGQKRKTNSLHNLMSQLNQLPSPPTSLYVGPPIGSVPFQSPSQTTTTRQQTTPTTSRTNQTPITTEFLNSLGLPENDSSAPMSLDEDDLTRRWANLQ